MLTCLNMTGAYPFGDIQTKTVKMKLPMYPNYESFTFISKLGKIHQTYNFYFFLIPWPNIQFWNNLQTKHVGVIFGRIPTKAYIIVVPNLEDKEPRGFHLIEDRMVGVAILSTDPPSFRNVVLNTLM